MSSLKMSRECTGNGDSHKPANVLSFLSHVKSGHLIAGISGGVASTLAVHPFDLLKIRLAVNDGAVSSRPHYRGFLNAVVTIFRQEGIIGFYRGVTPNCIGAGASWGFYFFFYNAIKSQMSLSVRTEHLGPGQHMQAAAEAGLMTLLMTNPIWVVKTRMCLQYTTSQLPEELQYKSTFDALRKIYRIDGVAGLYRGFIPGVFGVSHGALQFMAYEEMKKFYHSHHRGDARKQLGTLEYLVFAALSKLFATTATYPYQVVRARLQDQHKKYAGIVQCISRTWRFEGYKGFYKGLVPNTLRVTPATAITFVVYENIAKWLVNKDT
ncbi:solute carrier family 25 member 32-like [Dermacentor andersoni]|uniref:solute carrier family 25 member 32-like n=1 Tax=Dermacentor andersoni TaxID=34620 RepID=UPI003B3A3E74